MKTNSFSPFETLETFYVKTWQLCAGWDRVAFGAKQIRHILKTLKIELSFLPMGTFGACTLDTSRREIVLNPKLIPLRYQSSKAFPFWASSRTGAFTRFIFLHEVAHLLLHSSYQNIRIKGPLEAVERQRYVDGLAIDSKKFKILGNVPDHYADKPDSIMEAEADIYALVAMIPDYYLYRELKKGKPIEELSASVEASLNGAIAEDLGIVPKGFVKELADFRVLVFTRLSTAFLEVSNSLLLSKYKNPTCIDARLISEYKQTLGIPPDPNSLDAFLRELEAAHPNQDNYRDSNHQSTLFSMLESNDRPSSTVLKIQPL